MNAQPTQPSRPRWALWLPLLLISGWLAWEKPGVQPLEEAEIVQPITRSVPPTSEDQAPNAAARVGGTRASPLFAVIPRGELYAPEQGASPRDLFAAVDWTPPPPPPPVVAPAPPVAPALPFTYVGKRRENGTWQVFIGRGDDVLIVHEGQTLFNQYRVESVTPPQMTLTYLPLGHKQTLSIGEAP